MIRLVRRFSWLGLVALLTLAPQAAAQSAQDKATARNLAVKGIQLYQAGKTAEALENLSRAQRLYDAPVHVLYIARAQAKLGQLVEAAENYRKLVRTPVDASTAQAIRSAVDDAKAELPKIEPRIPTLKISLQPADVAGVKLQIDDQEVSAAIIDVDRPTNPGTRKVSAQADGYKVASKEITLSEGKPHALTLTLEKDPNAVMAGPTSGTGDGAATTGGGAAVGGEKPPPETPEKEKGAIGFLVGARLSGLVPTGTIFKEGTGGQLNDVAVTDFYGGGGAFELRGGFRFAKLFTGLLLVSVGGFQNGSRWDTPPGTTNSDSTVDSTTFHTMAGLGLAVGTPVGQLGGYGELDFLPAYAFETVQDIRIVGNATCTEQTTTLSGGAIRLLGGMNIPLSQQWHLSPFAGATFGTIRNVKGSGDCGADSDVEVPEDQRVAHTLIQLGIGIDWVLGPDNP